MERAQAALTPDYFARMAVISQRSATITLGFPDLHFTSPCGEVREIVRARLLELDERMAQMRRYRREMAETLKGWDQAGEVDGGICGLIEGSEIRNPINTNHAAVKKRTKKSSQ
jgi:MerR-like DNA binding protein